eukprot:TRINITY_DN749_c0_g1_i9.p1 TRINITY_DN749_c0_g1~~TRINITY_DN749_c0_g1_i9.p1  ORF type:complete len:177 (+),score=24.41 TRINITY_DN749_c0_g1_i9:54-584(+)
MGKTQSIFSRPATRRGSQNRDRQRDANSQQTSSTRPTSVETNTVNSGISRQSTTASVAPPGPETNTDSRVNPILVNRPSNSYPSVSKATSLQVSVRIIISIYPSQIMTMGVFFLKYYQTMILTNIFSYPVIHHTLFDNYLEGSLDKQSIACAEPNAHSKRFLEDHPNCRSPTLLLP